MGDHQFGSFTQGIIDLLINTTGEFVTERTIGGIVVYLGLFFATHHPAGDDGGDRRHNQHGQPQ